MKTFEIIAGTYEEFLIGYDFFSSKPRLVQSFASHDHNASLRSLATSSQYIASGGADDRIILYDFKLRKEHCMLAHHNATVNCLEFTPNHSHLLSGSHDGVLAITRVGNWQVDKLWEKAHKGSAIIDIAVHPSGKLALTLGEDLILRTWNLVKGRQAYAINLKSKSKDAKSLFKICWATDATRFILYGGKYTEIWSIESGGIIKAIEHDVKVTSCIWYSDKKILVGYEDGNICLVKLSSLKKHTYKIHKDRVKVLARHLEWIVSASSSGEIKVFNSSLDEICKINSGCRLTSLVIFLPNAIKKEEPEDKNILIETKEGNPEIQPSIKRKKKKHIDSDNAVDNDVPKKRKKKCNRDITEDNDVSIDKKSLTKKKKKLKSVK